MVAAAGGARGRARAEEGAEEGAHGGRGCGRAAGAPMLSAPLRLADDLSCSDWVVEIMLFSMADYASFACSNYANLLVSLC